MLLSGRVRSASEDTVIKGVLEKVFKRTITPSTLFDGNLVNASYAKLPGFEGIVWTPTFLRLLSLVYRALQFREPVLLVGETG